MVYMLELSLLWWCAWEPVFYIFGSLGFVWAALFAIYGGEDLCYDVDKEGKLQLIGLMDPMEVKYIEATRAKGPTKKKAKKIYKIISSN